MTARTRLKFVLVCFVLSCISMILILPQIDLDDYDDAPPTGQTICLAHHVARSRAPSIEPLVLGFVFTQRIIFAGVRSAVPIYSETQPAAMRGYSPPFDLRI
jgi:hypothetical protein